MRGGFTLGVLLVGLVLTVPVVPASAETGQFVVHAVGSATMEFSIGSPTRLNVDAATAAGGASYAVLHLTRVSSPEAPIDLAAAFLPAISGYDPVGLGATRSDLPAGRYQVTLLADGPVTVRVPATGAAAGVTLEPTTPVDSDFVQVEPPSTHPTPVTTYTVARLPFQAGQRALVLYGAVLELNPATLSTSDFDACLVAPGDSCSNGNPLYGTGSSGRQVERHRERIVGYANDEDLKAGSDFEAVTEYAGLNDPKVLRSFVLVVDLATADEPTPTARPVPAAPSPAPEPQLSLPATGADMPLVLATVVLTGAFVAARIGRAGWRFSFARSAPGSM